MEIAFFAASVVVFIAYITFASLFYKKKEKENFDMRNHFPFEMFIKKSDNNFMMNILLLIPFLLVATNFILFSINFYDVPTVLATFIAVALCFFAVASFVVPLSKFKEHCIISIFLLTFTAILNGFLIYKEIKLFSLNSDYILLLPMIINSIGGAFSIIMMFHPGLFKFEMEKDEFGGLKRPKAFVMTVGEWVSLFIILASQISIVIIKAVS